MDQRVLVDPLVGESIFWEGCCGSEELVSVGAHVKLEKGVEAVCVAEKWETMTTTIKGDVFDSPSDRSSSSFEDF